MEKLTRVIKYGVRTASKWAGQLLPRVLSAVSTWFREHPHSCYLYTLLNCTSVLADVSPELDEALFGAPKGWGGVSPSPSSHQFRAPVPPPPGTYISMSDAVSALVAPDAGATDVLGKLNAYPDVLEDYFELTIVMLRRFSKGVLGSTAWPMAMGLATSCLLLSHREAWRACTKFLESVTEMRTKRVDMSKEALDSLQLTLAAHGPLIAKGLVFGAAGGLPDSRVPRIGAVLRALVDAEPVQAPAWVQAACAELPDAVQAEAKELAATLAAAATTPVVDGRRASEPVRRSVDAFSEACRRLRVIGS